MLFRKQHIVRTYFVIIDKEKSLTLHHLLVSTKEIDNLRQNVKAQDQNNITADVFKDVNI